MCQQCMPQHIDWRDDRYAVKDSSMAFSPTPLGEALVGGYRDMQLNNLWLPSLRARIEQNITLVAQGRRTKVYIGCDPSQRHA